MRASTTRTTTRCRIPSTRSTRDCSALDTAVMAVAAYRLADAPEAPGRRLSATEATQLLKKLGLESLRRAVYEPGNAR